MCLSHEQLGFLASEVDSPSQPGGVRQSCGEVVDLGKEWVSGEGDPGKGVVGIPEDRERELPTASVVEGVQ